MSIVAKHITKSYGAQRALDNVSFQVKTGEVVGFLGPNGAGKSTMMKIITCFIPPTDGKVEVCGFSSTESAIAVRKNVGYLPENNPLYLDMYVKEYLGFVGGMYGISRAGERVKEMIKTVGLEKEQKKKIGALSKGYRQRIGLAQALIHDPSVLILDEPTSGLDPNQLTEIRALIKSIGQQKTVLLSTHIMQEVEEMCDRVIIIDQGRIVADDETGDILKNSSRSQTIFVEFDQEVSKEELRTIEGVNDAFAVEGEKSWRISTHANIDVRAAIFQHAVSHDYAVLTIRAEEEKLEDVFKKLTQRSVD